MDAEKEDIQRWRLILGSSSNDAMQKLGNSCGVSGENCGLSADQMIMDEALGAIYDESTEGSGSGERGAGLEGSAPRLNK